MSEGEKYILDHMTPLERWIRKYALYPFMVLVTCWGLHIPLGRQIGKREFQLLVQGGFIGPNDTLDTLKNRKNGTTR